MLPVVMITALDPGQERVKGIEAGADDFLTKPIHQPEILARVRSLLRIKSLYDELTELNRTLEQRVSEQVTQLERLSRAQALLLARPRRGDRPRGRRRSAQEPPARDRRRLSRPAWLHRVRRDLRA